MANNPSQIKRIGQDIKRRQRNRARVSTLRTAVKKVRTSVAEGNLDEAAESLPKAITILDRAAQAGAIHPNAAARGKSRLTRLVAQAQQAANQ